MSLSLSGAKGILIVGTVGAVTFGGSLALSLLLAPPEMPKQNKVDPDQEQIKPEPILAEGTTGQLERFSPAEQELNRLIRIYQDKAREMDRREGLLAKTEGRILLMQEALDNQAMEIRSEATKLDAAAKRVRQAIADLDSKITLYNRQEAEALQKNAAVLESMKPAAAAETIKSLIDGDNTKDAALMLAMLDERKAGKIFDAMDGKSRTSLLAQSKRLRETSQEGETQRE